MRTMSVLLLLLAGCLIPERSGMAEIGFVRDEALPVAFRLLQQENITAKPGDRVEGATVVRVPESEELRAQRILLDWRRDEPRPTFWTPDEWARR